MTKTITGAEYHSDIIAEMSGDPQSGGIDVDKDRISGLLEYDKDPLFVTLPIAIEGTSVNGRIYSRDNIDSIVQQINENQPDGYNGHLTKEERDHKSPHAQTIWLGAQVREVDGKAYAYAKGYVMPSAKRRREYLKTAKAIGKKVSVSVYGTFDGIYDKAKKTYTLAKVNLESVDWSRPGAEGLPVGAVPMIASEMAKDNDKEDEVDKVEVLKGATLSEMKEHNPQLVSEIESASSGIVSEMAEVKQTLGLDDKSEKKVTDVISEMQAELNKHEVDSELRDRVKVPAARQVIKSMVLSEMKSDEAAKDTVIRVLQSDDAKAIIESRRGEPKVNPNNDGKSQHQPGKFAKVTK